MVSFLPLSPGNVTYECLSTQVEGGSHGFHYQPSELWTDSAVRSS